MMMGNNWENMYQSVLQVQQLQNMAFNPINNLPQMNPMFNNMNQMIFNPTEQINNMSMFFHQNQNNVPQMFGGNQNFNMYNNKNKQKVNLCFSTMRGARINMIFDEDETVDSVLTKFLKRVNLDNLIGNLGTQLSFILSAETLRFGDHRKIKDLIFMPANFTTVLVHDSQNLIGAK